MSKSSRSFYRRVSLHTRPFLQTRKFKELLENRLGWEFKKKSSIDGICFDEDDEVNVLMDQNYLLSVLPFSLMDSHHHYAVCSCG